MTLPTALRKRLLFALITFLIGAHSKVALASSPERAISVADCVRTKRVYRAQVQLSPEGKEVAYVVKSPNIERNRNEFELYLRAVSPAGRRGNGRLLYRSDNPIDGLRWTRHPAKLVFLEQRARTGEIVSLDPQSHRREIVAKAESLSSFSVDAEGHTFIYSVEVNTDAKAARRRAEEYGFAVIFGRGVEPEEALPTSALFLVKRRPNAHFMTSRVSLRWSDETPPALLFSVQALSLSPDGEFLTFDFRSARIPERWRANAYTKFCELEGAEPMLLGIVDLSARKLRLAFDAPSAGFGLPSVWAADGRGFSTVALSPVGSLLEEDDRKMGFHDGMQFEHYTHLFSVNVNSLQPSLVMQQPTNWYQNDTLFWPKASGKMLVQETAGSYQWLVPESTDWRQVSKSHFPFGPVELRAGVFIAPLNASSDGREVVGVRENVSTPPDLFVHDLASARMRMLTDLNPEYRKVELGRIEDLEWRDDLGFRNTGYLIKPVRFEERKRYPLVIMVKGWGNFFLADTHFQTAFPPQPLAASGFVVLMANILPLDEIPVGYVGKMGEAYQFIAMIRAAVECLSARGWVDKNKVGLIGFSSTSWQTDFMITHSDFPLVAVSSADSGIRNYGSYWFLNSQQLMDDYEEILGGPPYGDTLTNTLQLTPAFNARNVGSPLLMEYTEFPGDLTGNMEFFVALKRQGKPVEMFSYPTGNHDLDVPSQRVASLQRNVDWFRFWMQHVEGSPPPYDTEQFIRWERLRRDADRHQDLR